MYSSSSFDERTSVRKSFVEHVITSGGKINSTSFFFYYWIASPLVMHFSSVLQDNKLYKHSFSHSHVHRIWITDAHSHIMRLLLPMVLTHIRIVFHSHIETEHGRTKFVRLRSHSIMRTTDTIHQYRENSASESNVWLYRNVSKTVRQIERVESMMSVFFLQSEQ